MRLNAPLMISAAIAAAVLMSSCSSSSSTVSGLTDYDAYDRPAKLPTNPDNVQVKVSLSKQRTYVMEGSEVLLMMPVSIGAPDSPTPSGNFRMISKIRKKRDATQGYSYRGKQVKKTMLSNRPPGWSFKGAPLPYWCEFKPNYGFHTGWIKHHPCTNGCIRIHKNLSPKFFRLVNVGTPVSIAYSQPEDTIMGNIPLPPDSGPLPDYDGKMYLEDGYFTLHKNPTFE